MSDSLLDPVQCPHCGKRFELVELRGTRLIPTHDFPKMCRQVCPGSSQIPRDINDRRPLWKDER